MTIIGNPRGEAGSCGAETGMDFTELLLDISPASSTIISGIPEDMSASWTMILGPELMLAESVSSTRIMGAESLCVLVKMVGTADLLATGAAAPKGEGRLGLSRGGVPIVVVGS